MRSWPSEWQTPLYQDSLMAALKSESGARLYLTWGPPLVFFFFLGPSLDLLLTCVIEKWRDEITYFTYNQAIWWRATEHFFEKWPSPAGWIECSQHRWTVNVLIHLMLDHITKMMIIDTHGGANKMKKPTFFFFWIGWNKDLTWGCRNELAAPPVWKVLDT